jgi:hypothetical protein
MPLIHEHRGIGTESPVDISAQGDARCAHARTR